MTFVKNVRFDPGNFQWPWSPPNYWGQVPRLHPEPTPNPIEQKHYWTDYVQSFRVLSTVRCHWSSWDNSWKERKAAMSGTCISIDAALDVSLIKMCFGLSQGCSEVQLFLYDVASNWDVNSQGKSLNCQQTSNTVDGLGSSVIACSQFRRRCSRLWDNHDRRLLI